jgi:hypothetical protein
MIHSSHTAPTTLQPPPLGQATHNKYKELLETWQKKAHLACSTVQEIIEKSATKAAGSRLQAR